MGTAIVIIVLIIILVPAVNSTLKHMKGQGDCCGGGGDTTEKVKKQKLDTVIANKRMDIEGMTCDHCKKRVENSLNLIDGVNARVSLGKHEAVIKLGKDVSDETLREAVEAQGYKVVSITAI